MDPDRLALGQLGDVGTAGRQGGDHHAGVARRLGEGSVVAPAPATQHAADAGARGGEEVARPLPGDQVGAGESPDEAVRAATAEKPVGALTGLDQLAAGSTLDLIVARTGANPGALTTLGVGDDEPVVARAEVNGAMAGDRDLDSQTAMRGLPAG